MAGPSPKRRVLELRDLLERANRAYFVDNQPTMPDSEYDALMRELIELERANPQLSDPASPSQRVGGKPLEGFRTLRHKVPMLSIDNSYTLDDLRAWDGRVRKALRPEIAEGEDDVEEPLDYVCDPKIDGVAVSLRYENGLLAVALTRGDGESGDDVTAQVRTIRAIPLRLRTAGGKPAAVLEVRGEIFMPNEEFQRINRRREQAGEPAFANARNATAGTLKQLDPAVVARRRLSFVAHGRGESEPPETGTFWDFLSQLKALGVPVSPHAARARGIEEVLEKVDGLRGARGSLGYGVDGIVVRVDRIDFQQKLGATSKAPRWCVAFKYPPEQATTRLTQVDWQVGKGGTLTPRATMEPILLAGTTVRHATLHNIQEIRRKDIRLGDTVLIEKAGDIIPQVVRVLTDKRRGKPKRIAAPRRCPACGGRVEQEGPKIYCVNPECPAQFREKVKWFVGRGQMDIVGFGEKLVDQLVDAGLVRHFADLFTLNRDALLKLQRMAEVSVDNLLEAAEASKTRGLARVLGGLGIRHIGTTAARALASHFPDAKALLESTEEDLLALPDFGEVMASTLAAFLRTAEGRRTFDRLAAVGVDLTSHRHAAEPNRTASGNHFEDRTIVLTGTLEHFSRTELSERLATLGATVTGSVSARTDLLIAGKNPGSKLDKARDLGIEIWNEEQLLAALK
ncbi:MAG: NAD-dependent DNA ligase LigA [Planctomycetes bacterium]|nr:NAD-dependent DNA ligase LigA [Planctomycetota bacterium]